MERGFEALNPFELEKEEGQEDGESVSFGDGDSFASFLSSGS